jgi:hypothetical protein
VHNDLQGIHFRELQSAADKADVPVDNIGGIAGRPTVLRAEPGKSHSRFREKFLISSLQMQLDIAEGHGIHFFQPGKFRFILGRRIAQHPARLLVCFNFVRQHTVIKDTAASEGSRKLLLLPFVWIQTETVRFITFSQACHLLPGFRYIPGLPPPVHLPP